ncbi:MAG: stage III sporulation protein AG [Bacillota bacterium]|nr:stage III sporulation protein AG [Bacillota bacterium]MDI7248493.1 stage III sporulation protein AG [Bacillota bacterium]
MQTGNGSPFWKLWGQGPRPSPWLLLAGVVGVILIVAGSWLGQRQPEPPRPVRQETEVMAPAPAGAGLTPRDLEGVLSLVAGAGEVTVSITYRSGPRQEVVQDVSRTTRRTEEKEAGGTVRVTEEEQESVQAVMARPGGQDQPVVSREQAPEIAGVLVVAGGARDPAVREMLSRAVQTLLGLPAHRVQVVPAR